MLPQPALERGNCACNFPSRREQYLAGSKVPGNLVKPCHDVRYRGHPLDNCILSGGAWTQPVDEPGPMASQNTVREKAPGLPRSPFFLLCTLYSIPRSGVCPGPNRYGVSPRWLASLCSLYMAPSSPAHIPVWGFLSISLISSLCHRGYPPGHREKSLFPFLAPPATLYNPTTLALLIRSPPHHPLTSFIYHPKPMDFVGKVHLTYPVLRSKRLR